MEPPSISGPRVKVHQHLNRFIHHAHICEMEQNKIVFVKTEQEIWKLDLHSVIEISDAITNKQKTRFNKQNSQYT
jgi:hypothetical protein